jgi:hypothetical protein
MKNGTILTALSLALAGGAFTLPSALAGDLALYEIATPDAGLASADYAAGAQDASTRFKNPAGMSLLPETPVEAGAPLICSSVKLSPDASTGPLPGAGNGGNAIGALPVESAPRPLYRPWTLGVEAGTTGVGGFVSWRFIDHWGARAGFDYFQFSENNLQIKDINYDAKVRLMSEPLTLDFYPWKKHSFHISAGVLFNQNELTGTADDTRVITIGHRPIQIFQGTLDLKVQQQLVNPYLGIGGNFFYFDHAHRWAMGGELGVAYTGDPKVSLTWAGGRSGRIGSLTDSEVRNEQGKIQDYADQFRWWPVLKLNVSYSF